MTKRQVDKTKSLKVKKSRTMQVHKGTMFEEFLSAWLWWKKEERGVEIDIERERKRRRGKRPGARKTRHAHIELKKGGEEIMKSLLRVVMVLSGIALIIGIVYYVQAEASVTTADDYKTAIGAGIVGISLLPFVISLGFYKVVDMLEGGAEQRKIWLEGINYNLLEIRKNI